MLFHYILLTVTLDIVMFSTMHVWEQCWDLLHLLCVLSNIVRFFWISKVLFVFYPDCDFFSGRASFGIHILALVYAFMVNKNSQFEGG